MSSEVPRMPAMQFFAVMALILGASLGMFALLVYRWTTGRRWTELSEWARDRGLRLMRSGGRLPDALRGGGVPMRVQVSLESDRLQLVQFVAEPAAAAAGQPQGEASRWNLLVQKLEAQWPVTGLRPSHAALSILDLCQVPEVPGLAGTERFTVRGVDYTAARALMDSAVRGLLPPDIGFLLSGEQLILDFGARPFDTVEFDRLVAVADQVVRHLPVARRVE